MKLYPSATLAELNVEQKLQKIKNKNNFNNSLNNIKEMISYGKAKCPKAKKSQKIEKNYPKTLQEVSKQEK